MQSFIEKASTYIISPLKGVINGGTLETVIVGLIANTYFSTEEKDPTCPVEVSTLQCITYGVTALIAGSIITYYKINQTRFSHLENRNNLMNETLSLIATSQPKQTQTCIQISSSIAGAAFFTVGDAFLNALPYLKLTSSPVVNITLAGTSFVFFTCQNGFYVHELRTGQPLPFRQSHVGFFIDVISILLKGIATKISLLDILNTDSQLLKWLVILEPTIFMTKYSNYQNNIDLNKNEEFTCGSRSFQVIANSAYALQDGALYTHALLKSKPAFQLLHCMGHVASWHLLIPLTAVGFSAYFQKNGEFSKAFTKKTTARLTLFSPKTDEKEQPNISHSYEAHAITKSLL